MSKPVPVRKVRIGRHWWTVVPIAKARVKTKGGGEPAFGVTLDDRRILFATGTEAKPLALVEQLDTLAHEAVHAAFIELKLEEKMAQAVAAVVSDFLAQATRRVANAHIRRLTRKGK